MKLAIISNNYGKAHDGIGAYSKAIASNFSENIESIIFTASCEATDITWKKIFNFGMTKNIFNVAKQITQNKIDIVLIEYPFVEWNPFIIMAFKYLSKCAKKQNIKIVVSIHEFQRVNILRKLVVKKIANIANELIVSNSEMGEAIIRNNQKYTIRPIPSNIDKQHNVHELKRDYVFFGLVNKSKAFDGLLEAWKLFSDETNRQLHIISGTNLQDIELKYNNIKYYYKATDQDVSRIMSNAAFSIVPIIPMVDMKNTTFKTSCLMGCISVGLFCDEYKKHEFVYHMPNYQIETFLDVFTQLEKLDQSKIEELSIKAEIFYSTFSIQSVARLVENIILKKTIE